MERLAKDVSNLVQPIFVSYYTNPRYEVFAKDKLIPSLENFGLDYDISRVESLGSWERDVSWKPMFILGKVLAHPGRNVVWIDADAEIVAFPRVLFTIPGYFLVAAHFSALNRLEIPELYGGTLFFRNTPFVIAIVKEWAIQSLLNTNKPDQKHLDEIVHGKAWTYELPATYTWIEYAMRGPLGEDVKPVIVHYHAGLQNSHNR